jgi:hypothetical protein
LICTCVFVATLPQRAQRHIPQQPHTSSSYLADPPLLELGGDSTSSSPYISLQLQPEVPPAIVVPAGIVAQRRKSYSDHASAAAVHRAPFTPELPLDIVTSAGYMKTIAQRQYSAADSVGQTPPASASLSASNTRQPLANAASPFPTAPAHPSASEPSTILAPATSFQRPAAAHPLPPALVFDVLPGPRAAPSEAMHSSLSQVIH